MAVSEILRMRIRKCPIQNRKVSQPEKSQNGKKCQRVFVLYKTFRFRHVETGNYGT